MIVLAACGIAVAVALNGAGTPALVGPEVRRTTPPALRLPAWLPMASLVGGLLSAAASTAQVMASAPTSWDLPGAGLVTAPPAAAQSLWLIGVAIPLVMLSAAWLMRRPWRGFSWPDVAWMGLIFALAMAMRVPAITSSPPFVHGDEAICGLYGRFFNQGRAPLLAVGWNSLPMLSYALDGIGMRLFGDNLTGLRLANATLGSGSVVLAYLLGRELFGRVAGVLGGIILAVTFVDVDLSRDGLHSIQGPIFTTLTVYLAVYWLRRGGALTAFLTGVSVIIDVQVYWGARVAPILVLCLLLFVAVGARSLIAARLAELPWVVAGVVVAGLPVAAMFAAIPGSFAGHDTAVNVLGHDPGTMGHLQSAYGTSAAVPVLLRQAWTVATTFNLHADASLQVGWGGAMLDTVSAALLPAALVLGLLRWRRWQYLLPLAWFAAVAGAGIITIDPPWWPRLATLLPAVALLLGVLLAEAARAARRPLAVAKGVMVYPGPIVVVALLVCLAVGNARLVFFDYPAAAAQGSSMAPTLVGRFLSSDPGADQTVLLSDGSFSLDYDTVVFLAPHAGGCTLFPGDPPSHCPNYRSSRLYVLLPSRVGELAQLQQQRPGGTTVEVGSFSGLRIVAYEAPAS